MESASQRGGALTARSLQQVPTPNGLAVRSFTSGSDGAQGEMSEWRTQPTQPMSACRARCGPSAAPQRGDGGRRSAAAASAAAGAVLQAHPGEGGRWGEGEGWGRGVDYVCQGREV